MRWKLFIIIVILLSSALSASQLIDRIVAVVETEVVTQGELEEELWMFLQTVPVSRPELIDSIRREILSQMIDNTVLYLQAIKETLYVDPEELDKAVESAMAELVSRFPSRTTFEVELLRRGINEGMLREHYKRTIRRNLLVQKLIQKDFQPDIYISEEEIRNFYDKYADSLQTPDSLYVYHFQIPLVPSEEEEKAAQKKADGIKEKLDNGADFATLAEQYSDDRASAVVGGDLGFLPKSALYPEIRETLWQMDVGEHKVVRSRVGYHIVRCEEERDGAKHFRHILVMLLPSKEDSLKALKAVEEKRGSLSKAGDPEQAGLQGQWIVLSDVDVSIQGVLDTLPLNVPSEPVFSGGACHLFLVTKKIEGKVPPLGEVRQMIKEFLSKKKWSDAYRKWVKSIREQYYVEVKLEE